MEKTKITRGQYEDLVNKAILEELSSVVAYSYQASLVKSDKIRKEYYEHISDELEHYTKLLKYCRDINIEAKNIGAVDKSYRSVIDDGIRSLEFNLKKEDEAINNYTKLQLLADKINCIQGQILFKELLEKEMEHKEDLEDILNELKSNPTQDTNDVPNTSYSDTQVDGIESHSNSSVASPTGDRVSLVDNYGNTRVIDSSITTLMKII